MRRGLISHSTIELPDAVLDARLDRAARGDARQGSTRSSSTPTTRARPACRGSPASCRTGRRRCWSCRATARRISSSRSRFRVKTWIERTSRVADVLHTPRIGLGAAQQIAAMQADAAVGIVDLDGLPAGIVDDLREGGPRPGLDDASALFARCAAKADPAEIALGDKAASIAPSRLLPPKATISTR